jgi:hypothetical protein
MSSFEQPPKEFAKNSYEYEKCIEGCCALLVQTVRKCRKKKLWPVFFFQKPQI